MNSRQFMFWYIVGVLLELQPFCVGEKGTWSSDLSSMKIGISLEGFHQAVVHCNEEDVAFVVTMEEDFHGVLYTRGNFHNKNSNCFKKGEGGRDFALKFGYNDCGLKKDDVWGGYTATVIVQHDEDFIIPGDLAFAVYCRKPGEDEAGDTEDRINSRIKMVAADPSSGPDDGEDVHAVDSTQNIAVLNAPPPTPHLEL